MEDAPKNHRIIFHDKNDIPPDELEKQRIIAEEKKEIERETKMALIKQLKLFIVSNPYSSQWFLDDVVVCWDWSEKRSVIVRKQQWPQPFIDFANDLLKINPNIDFLWHHHRLPLPEIFRSIDVEWNYSATDEKMRDMISVIMDIDISQERANNGNNNMYVNNSKMYQELNKPEDDDFEKWKKANKAFVDRQYGYGVTDKHEGVSSKQSNQWDDFSHKKEPVIVWNTGKDLPDGSGNESESDLYPDLPF